MLGIKGTTWYYSDILNNVCKCEDASKFYYAVMQPFADVVKLETKHNNWKRVLVRLLFSEAGVIVLRSHGHVGVHEAQREPCAKEAPLSD